MNERQNEPVLFRKKDVLVYSVLAVFFLSLLFLVSHINGGRGSNVLVQINGEACYRFSILDSGVYPIAYEGKHLMDLVIDREDVYIRDSECPLHLCERDHLNDSGVLVCVPQKVLVTFDDEKVVDREKEVDLVTR
ncbi:MAG TPA: NusG domain II-containing protein [Thermotogota bacterium]|nr:NusG domain II-containing protein [Thermotogota bacterium]HPJ88500.1 NusG domain II-containing protein [Thermotogota bacterium]HPR96200.1 NusG domain II-containing protein [Thermotogota bacterium]